jgi:hypothetical protein
MFPGISEVISHLVAVHVQVLDILPVHETFCL